MVSITDTITYSYAQNTTGDRAFHFGDGGIDDPALLYDGDVNTELRMHELDVYELDFGQTIDAGTSISLIEGTGGEDANVDVYVSIGSTDPSGDANSGTGGGVGYDNLIAGLTSVPQTTFLIYSGPSDADVVFDIPADGVTHIQFVGQDNHGGWGEVQFTDLVGGSTPGPGDLPGDDTISGGEGNDFIDGAGGALDILTGDGGDDTFAISTGVDQIDGGIGTDTYDATSGSTLSDETITVDVDNAGDGTVAKTDDATTDTITSVETYVADEATAEADVITITDTDIDDATTDPTGTLFLRSEVSGLDDTAVGTFVPQNGDPTVTFGPGTGTGPGGSDILLSSILADNVPGQIQITSGDESGTVGNISFENFEEINFGIMCFARGTLIKTIEGERPIEELSVGDRVLTMDNSYQEIRWIGSRDLDDIDLTMNPKLKPILIRADALGSGVPERDLVVSPQHRILIRSVIAERMFGQREVLMPANKLLTIDGIDILHHTPDGVEYWHMLFEDHQIVWSNGAPSESLFTGPEALKAVSPEGRLEIQTLFPEICAPNYIPTPARYIPEKGKLMKKLAQRHHANKKPLVILHS